MSRNVTEQAAMKTGNWLARYKNRSYLAKWTLIGLLIGLVAGFGATAFYFIINLVSDYLLFPLTGFNLPTPAGEAIYALAPFSLATISSPRYYMIPVSTIIARPYYLTGPEYTIYKSQVYSKADSPAHRGEYNIPLITTLRVEAAMKKDLITLSPNGTAEEAFRIMSDKKIQGIPVISPDRHIQGIVKMSDVMRVPNDKLRTTLVENLMTKNVISVYPDDTLLVALEKLTEHAIGRLPIIDKETKEIVGIVSRSDLFSTYEKNIARYPLLTPFQFLPRFEFPLS